MQSDLLDGLDSCVVIPLRRREHFPAVPLADRLTPALSISGAEFILETPKMGAVPRRALGAPLVSLAAERAQVTAAMEFVFRGI
ncbi:MAG: CcdB family protein [Gammaproteobacteria bacterium]